MPVNNVRVAHSDLVPVNNVRAEPSDLVPVNNVRVLLSVPTRDNARTRVSDRISGSNPRAVTDPVDRPIDLWISTSQVAHLVRVAIAPRVAERPTTFCKIGRLAINVPAREIEVKTLQIA